jgi:hypothetical protein
MKQLIITMASIFTVWVGSAAPASAMECQGIDIPDSVAAELLNQQVAGASYKISSLKRLEINRVDSISGSDCSFRANVNVTLHRKIRRDATGTVVLKGTLDLSNEGKICVAGASVADVDVSNTLSLGEAIYKWVANMVLPDNMCF